MSGTPPAIPALGSGIDAAWMVDCDVRYGLLYIHPADTSTGRCESGVFFDVPLNEHIPPERRWTVESLDPLTLSPSLLCAACGHHGFIRDGRWVPA